MHRPLIRIVLETVAALIVGTAVLLAAGFWWLSRGPVSLTFLTPLVEEGLNDRITPYAVTIGETRIIWAGWERWTEFAADDVVMRDASGHPVLTLPVVLMDLSPVDLLRGVVRPTRLDIAGANILMVRRSDGAVHVGKPATDDAAGNAANGTGNSAQGETNGIAPGIAGALLSAPMDTPLLPTAVLNLMGAETGDPVGRFAAPLRIRISDSSLEWRDDRSGFSRRLEAIAGDLTGNANGREFTLAGRFADTGAAARMHGGYDAQTQLLRLNLSLDPISLDDIAALYPDAPLWPLSEPHGVLDVGLTFDGEGRPLSGVIALTGEGEPAKLDIRIDQASGRLDGVLQVPRMRLAELGSALPNIGAVDMSALALLDTELRLDADFSLDAANLRLQRGTVAFTGDAGVIRLPAFFEAPLDVASVQGRIAVTAQPGDGIDGGGYDLDLASLTINLGAPELNLSGVFAYRADELTGTLKARVTDMQASLLKTYWPPQVGSDAYDWVTANITEARVPLAETSFSLTMPGLDVGRATITDLEGGFELFGARVDYFAPFPPARGVDARARFGADWLTIGISAGSIRDISTSGGRVEFTRLGTPDEAISIDLPLQGRLSTALDVLDTPPHELVGQLLGRTGLNADAGMFDGHTNADVHFDFELRHDLRPEEVNFAAAARLRDVTLPFAPTDRQLIAPELALELDNTGLTLEGGIGLAEHPGTPVKLHWRENFGAAEPLRTLHLAGNWGAAELEAIGIDTKPYMGEGKAAIRLNHDVGRAGDWSLGLAADLAPVSLAVPLLAWQKPADMAAYLSMQMNRTPDAQNSKSVTADIDFRAHDDSDDARIAARLQFTPALTELIAADITELSMGANRFTAQMRSRPGGGYAIRLIGRQLDLAGLLTPDRDETGLESGTAAKGTPFDVTAKIATLVDSSTQSSANGAGSVASLPEGLKNVRVKLRHDGQDAESVQLLATVGAAGELSIDYHPEGQERHLAVSTDDAGGVLRALDWSSRLDRGTLRISGYRSDVDAPLEGSFTLDQFGLSAVPALAKILEFMTVTGSLSALTEQGLSFSRLRGDFAYQDGVAQFFEAGATSNSFGFTVEGEFDPGADHIALTGTIAPMNLINRFLGLVPIVGPIISGDEGIFAADYRIDGSLGDPDVRINPLSVLAPGILRRMIAILPEGDGGGAAVAPATR